MKLNDKTTLNKLRDAIDKALAPVAEEMELTSLKAGNISYDADGLAAKITLKATAKSADGKTKEENDFVRLADIYGLKPERLHQTITHGASDHLKIVGLAPNRSKFPVIVLSWKTNKRLLITAKEVQFKLNKGPWKDGMPWKDSDRFTPPKEGAA
jgi:hypothetical protein